MNRLNIKDKADCTGCGACLNACLRDAIVMQADEEGFPYPVINDDVCIDCGRCVTVCPINNTPTAEFYGLPLEEATVYAAWSRDEERRINSTSGGIFSELAQYVFRQGGYVAGAVYDERFAIHHILTDDPEDLKALRQSKYAQSDINLVFREVNARLKEGKLVLFCGTPCQSAGLRAMLGCEMPNLLLCDFICRGINSPKAYQSYLEMLQRRYNSQVEQVQFKNKDFGWNRFHTKVTFANGKTYCQDRSTDPFMIAYLQYNLFMRPSCHICQFKGHWRNVDLTLGDFWGVGQTRPDLDTDQGTSVVIVSSPKGRVAMDAIRHAIVCEIMALENVKPKNRYLTEVVPSGNNRKAFFDHLNDWPFEKLMKCYASPSWRKRWMGRLRGLKARLLQSFRAIGIKRKGRG